MTEQLYKVKAIQADNKSVLLEVAGLTKEDVDFMQKQADNTNGVVTLEVTKQ